MPYEQHPGVKYLDLCVRTAGSPAGLLAEVRRAIASVYPSVALFAVRTQEAQIEDLLLTERMLAMLAAFFGVSAAAIAAIGLYGVLSFLVETQRRDIGIRMALGARPVQAARRVVTEAWLWMGLGFSGACLRPRDSADTYGRFSTGSSRGTP